MNESRIFNSGGHSHGHRLHLNETKNKKLQKLSSLFLKEFEKVSEYPDPECLELKKKLPKIHHVSQDMIIIGNGVDEIILLLCLAYLTNGGSTLVSEKTFPGHETATYVAGGRAIKVPLINLKCAPLNYKKCISPDTKLAFLCNPHNPTGLLMENNECDLFTSLMNRNNIIPVFDEAYIQFSHEKKYSMMKKVQKGENLIVLRTFSKAYGLARLRIGYAIAPKNIIDKISISTSAIPFRVNRFAQSIALASLEKRPNIDVPRKVKLLIDECIENFKKKNLCYIPSMTNFICFKPKNNIHFFLKNAKCLNIKVRDCATFGMKGWIRASLSSKDDLEILLKLIDKENPKNSYNETT